MPLDVPVQDFTNAKLRPFYNPKSARSHPINLAPNSTYLRGQTLGQVSAAANAVHRITLGTANGGTYTLTVEYPVGHRKTTAALAHNANAAAIQAALAALSNVGAGNVSVAGSGPIDITFIGKLGNRPVPTTTIASALTGGSAHAVASQTVGATAGTFKAYATANVDGSGVFRCLCPYDCQTDAAGMISLGDVGGQWAEKSLDIEAYFGGCFLTSELVGFDADALADCNGKLSWGTVSDGLLEF